MTPAIRRARIPLLALATLVGAGSLLPPARAAGEPVWPVAGDPPAVRATNADGTTFAHAAPRDERGRRSIVHLLDGEGRETGAAELPGRVHALQFDAAATRLYALVERPSRRGAGERELHAIALDGEGAGTDDAVPELETDRLMQVPRGAADLDLWTMESALLMAVPDQIRTVLLRGLRSGPLFPVPGRNRAVASLGGGSLILAGQDDALLLLDLADPPGRDAMPVLERWVAPAPVVAIVPTRDASGARIELADGTRRRVTLAPFAVVPDPATGAPVAAPFAAVRPPAYRKPAPPSPSPSPRKEVRTPVVPAPEPEARAGADADAAPRPASADAGNPRPPEPQEEPEPGTGTQRPAAPSRSPSSSPPSSSPSPSQENVAPRPTADPPQPAEAVAPEEPVELPPATAGSLAGRVVGPAADQVTAILFHGPNSILREAARVPVADDGTWRATGLAPGRYKVQVDGGGDRVLASDPPFRLIELEQGVAPPSISFRVLRKL